MKKTNTAATGEAENALLVAISRLRAQGYSQSAIASQLDISQARVCRLIQDAVGQKMLNENPTLRREFISDGDWETAETLYFQNKKAEDKLRHLVSAEFHLRVSVIAGGEKEFIAGASQHVLMLLKRSRHVGVMWGRTISQVVAQIQDATRGSRAASKLPLSFIPLCGDPVHLMNQGEMGYSASHISAQLGVALSAQERLHPPCLAGVPAYVAPRLLHSPTFREFLDSIPGYREIFGDDRDQESPLIDSVDTVISGLGIISTKHGAKEHETSAFIRERLAQDTITKGELHRLVLGDIGGVLLEQHNLKPEQRNKVAELNEGWTGLKTKHLQRVARAARPKGLPGVIVIVRGAEKSAMLKEIVRRRFANQLLIDRPLANAL